MTIKGTLVKINVSGSAGKGKGAKPEKPEEPKEAQVQTPIAATAPSAGDALVKLPNTQVRKWYLDQTTMIALDNARWIREGIPLGERARRAHEIRHNARLSARAMMTNPAEVSMLRTRDMKKYGNPDGPTFDQLVKQHRENGHSLEGAYEEVISGSQRTNAAVNRKLEVKP